MMDAAAILAASHTTLFPGDEAAVNTAFRALAKRWHPDKNPGHPLASDVFAHISAMHMQAKARTMPKSNTRFFDRPGQTTISMLYLRKRSYEAGDIYVGQSSVVYTVGQGYADLPLLHPAAGHYANDTMKTEMERFMPNLTRQEDIDSGKMVVFRRTPDQVLLADIITALGKVEPAHVAWMISGMLNLACYLEWAGVIHGGISPDTILVSPEKHTVSLVGPALYSQKMGIRPDAIAMPGRTIRAVPKVAIKGTHFDSSIDLRLIRETAMEALGEFSAPKLLNHPAILKSMGMWLISAAPKSARADYAAWEKARGPRSFAEFKITPQDIY